MADPLVAFFRGAPDSEGRTLDEILAWDDAALEDVHDYVQWIFPTARPSDFNPDAPVVTRETIAAFAADPALRERLVAALERMLRFYGFELAPGPSVRRGANWAERREEWLTPGNHNLLRITRILDSLSSLGLVEHARAFLRALDELDSGEDARVIGARTFRFWRSAVR